MGRLIQVSVRPGPEAAQARTTSWKAVSTRTSNGSLRTVRAMRRETWKPFSGITPRRSGSIRNTRASSRASAIGNTPRA